VAQFLLSLSRYFISSNELRSLRVFQFRFISVKSEGLKTEVEDESALVNCFIGRTVDIVSLLFALVTTQTTDSTALYAIF